MFIKVEKNEEIAHAYDVDERQRYTLLTHDFYINLNHTNVVEFILNDDSCYLNGDIMGMGFKETIVFFMNDAPHILLFNKNSMGEYHRIKREFEEYVSDIKSTKKQKEESVNKGV